MPKAARAGYYAVRVGRTPGIYQQWSECEKQVKGFPKARYKKFPTKEEATKFMSSDAQGSAIGDRHRAKPVELNEDIRRTSFIVDMYDKTTFESDLKSGNLESTDKPEMKKDDTVTVFTDGASSGNGTSKAYAGVGVFWGPNDERNVSEPLLEGKQTNQRAEIKAVIRAIETCGNDKCILNIHTDSMYAVKAVTEWRKKWERNNDWLTSERKPVENKDLFQVLFQLIDSRPGPVKMTHIPGHAGIPGNEMADRLAVNGAMQNARVKR